MVESNDNPEKIYYEASLNQDDTSPNIDMRMDLELKSWAKNKKDYNSDHNEISEEMNHFKKF